jgi:hypothetical protein
VIRDRVGFKACRAFGTVSTTCPGGCARGSKKSRRDGRKMFEMDKKEYKVNETEKAMFTSYMKQTYYHSPRDAVVEVNVQETANSALQRNRYLCKSSPL